MGTPLDLVSLVKTFQERVNRHDVEKIMTMFTEDATFEIVGVSNFSGKQQIKNVFEYDAGVNTKLRLTDCQWEGITVRCQLFERNDRLDAIGINELKYDSCIFTFKDGLIQSFAAEIPSDVFEHNSKIFRKFIPWLGEKYPTEYSRMFTSKGGFIYNYENGRDVVPLLRKWDTEQ